MNSNVEDRLDLTREVKDALIAMFDKKGLPHVLTEARTGGGTHVFLFVGDPLYFAVTTTTTALIHHRRHQTHVVISPDTAHDPSAVFHYNDLLIEKLKTQIKDFKMLHATVDGAPTQFDNKDV